MNDRHDNFDAEKLIERKQHYCGFRFCPLCGKAMREGVVDGRHRMFCSDTDCGYVFYQNPIPAAGAIIVVNDQILLVQRAHPPRVGWWCIPAGFMEWHEHPTDTTIREIREETGLEIELTSFFEVYSGQDDPRSNAILLLYLAKVVGGQLQAADDALDVKYFGFDNLPNKIAFEAHAQALKDYNRRMRHRE